MRSVGSEFLSVMVVLSVPLGIVAVFPFSAFGFKAAEEVRRPSRTALVMLTPEAERQVLRTVRASWREKAGGARLLQTELFRAVLPEDERRSVLTVRDRSRPPVPPAVLCERTPFLPSLRAPTPAPIAVDAAVEQLPFPRKDLLKMN